MIKRALQPILRRTARRYPVVTLTGPGQSWKTTLVRAAFPRLAYASLEDPDQGAFALEDPRGFLDQFDGGVILDEVQRTPDLFSHVQGRVDEDASPARYILSGSRNFLLLGSISHSWPAGARSCTLTWGISRRLAAACVLAPAETDSCSTCHHRPTTAASHIPRPGDGSLSRRRAF